MLHHCEKPLLAATVARGGKLIGQPVWPNSFLLLADSLCHRSLRPAVMTSQSFASRVRAPSAVRGLTSAPSAKASRGQSRVRSAFGKSYPPSAKEDGRPRAALAVALALAVPRAG